MSEILHLTVSLSDDTANNFDKHAHNQNAATNPVEYFQFSEQRYYFTSLNTGFYVSSKCAGNPSSDVKDNEILKRKIYKFSRRIDYRRIHPTFKNNLIGKLRKLAKYKYKIKQQFPNTLELHSEVRKLVRTIRELKNSLEYKLKNTLPKRTNMKTFLFLTKTRFHNRAHYSIGDDADVPFLQKTKHPKGTEEKGDNKSDRKLLRVTSIINPAFKERCKKYITYTEQFYKSKRSDLKTSQGSANVTVVGNRPPTPELYMGRNPKYPAVLNELFNPNKCDVCNVKMNSPIAAHRHYISYPHKKRVKNWFRYKFPTNTMDIRGTPHFISSHISECYCSLCTVKLSTTRLALQHYNGRRHRAAVLKKTQLKGIGYFSVKGEWIETGKVIDKSTGKESTHIFLKTLRGIEQVPLYDASEFNLESDIKEFLLNKAKNERSKGSKAVNTKDSIEEEFAAFLEAVNTEKNEGSKGSKAVNTKDSIEEEFAAFLKAVNTEESVEEERKTESDSVIFEQQNTSSEEKDVVENIQTDVDDHTAQCVNNKTVNPEYTNTQNIENSLTASVVDCSKNKLQDCSEDNNSNITDILSPFEQQTFVQAMDTLFCALCNITATSRKPMLLHLKGARHWKKMKSVGETQKPFVTVADSLVLKSSKDVSIFRTPSGSYYCDLCNIAFSDRESMSIHMITKRHPKWRRGRKKTLKFY